MLLLIQLALGCGNSPGQPLKACPRSKCERQVISIVFVRVFQVWRLTRVLRCRASMHVLQSDNEEGCTMVFMQYKTDGSVKLFAIMRGVQNILFIVAHLSVYFGDPRLALLARLYHDFRRWYYAQEKLSILFALEFYETVFKATFLSSLEKKRKLYHNCTCTPNIVRHLNAHSN